jgi:hypothetical protein
MTFERGEVHLRIKFSFAATSMLLSVLKELPGLSAEATVANAIPNDDQADGDGEDEGGDGIDLRSDAAAEAAPDLEGERKKVTAISSIESVKIRRPAAMRESLRFGSVTRQNVCHGVAPRSSEASSARVWRTSRRA